MVKGEKPNKILIVDDDEFVCNIYEKSFKEEGVETETVHSGKEMLERMRKEDKPEMVVLDIFMPEMNGFEALESAHKENLLDRSIVLILSNHADQIAQEKAAKLGAKKFIVKSSLLPTDIISEVMNTYQEEKIP